MVEHRPPITAHVLYSHCVSFLNYLRSHNQNRSYIIDFIKTDPPILHLYVNTTLFLPTTPSACFGQLGAPHDFGRQFVPYHSLTTTNYDFDFDSRDTCLIGSSINANDKGHSGESIASLISSNDCPVKFMDRYSGLIPTLNPEMNVTNLLSFIQFCVGSPHVAPHQTFGHAIGFFNVCVTFEVQKRGIAHVHYVISPNA
ncbi:uncharacterized protein MELLADRAFT_114074 [Melampsora larici-populina 98AG31]|uniref:Uncharacterized protein n=1 Tax=Melampsora larici-populina (strain 98AG31 / pathotype 3-4-7) TaxID=747676 RepID=F4SC34_MELLP|nr:uncharacterized protein MELLADRAFT_114074 [Melampsora larici-populina 98AG31]EGF97781.1 hypothetical protein MELLADRAFT_114074 [Melampsora larici-populina 98AG31]